MSRALDALRRHAQGECFPDEVMRELVSHQGWFVPAAWALRDLDTETLDQTCAWGESSTVPQGRLWLFTDEEAGKLMSPTPGPYVGPCRGSVVFEKIPQGTTFIDVNPRPPPEKVWSVGGEGIAHCRFLGRAVGIEETLASGGDVTNRLLDFDRFIVLFTADEAMATAPGACGLKSPGLIFTAPDCRDAALKAIGPSAATMKSTLMTGRSLFGHLEALAIDGLIVNVAGPPNPVVLEREDCTRIARAIQRPGPSAGGVTIERAS